MFGIGITEIILILVVALLLIGPDKLPELAKSLGKGLAEFKHAADNFRDTIHVDLDKEINIKNNDRLLNKKYDADGESDTEEAEDMKAEAVDVAENDN